MGITKPFVEGDGGISTYTNEEQKEEKKGKESVQTHLKAARSPVQELSLYKMQVPSARITIKHHTSTGEIGILRRKFLSALSSAPRRGI
ncbi:hypothetical protein J6590_084517 [Homalodisca vitripennis]|nr:hypothetical protein J6590_084517 [Homalodisca vitripennis]